MQFILSLLFIFIHTAQGVITPTISTTFTAVKTGALNASTTWLNGQIPSGQCSIIIQSGVIVTFTGEILAINVQTLTIAGSFVITSSASGGGFTFQFPINIIVQAGGAFYDHTNLNQ